MDAKGCFRSDTERNRKVALGPIPRGCDKSSPCERLGWLGLHLGQTARDNRVLRVWGDIERPGHILPGADALCASTVNTAKMR